MFLPRSNSLKYPRAKSANHCLTELFSIYQNKHWTIRRRDDHIVVPSSNHNKWKIDWLLVIHYTKASLKRKQVSIKGFVFFLIHFLRKNMFSGFAFVPTFFRVTVFPRIVSALEQFPPLNSFRTCMYCDQRSQYIRLNSKKNSFRGNYSRKYGICMRLR